MATKTPEMKLAAIFQEVGLEKFTAMTKLILALNTPKKARKKKDRAETATA